MYRSDSGEEGPYRIPKPVVRRPRSSNEYTGYFVPANFAANGSPAGARPSDEHMEEIPLREVNEYRNRPDGYSQRPFSYHQPAAPQNSSVDAPETHLRHLKQNGEENGAFLHDNPPPAQEYRHAPPPSAPAPKISNYADPPEKTSFRKSCCILSCLIFLVVFLAAVGVAVWIGVSCLVGKQCPWEPAPTKIYHFSVTVNDTNLQYDLSFADHTSEEYKKASAEVVRKIDTSIAEPKGIKSSTTDVHELEPRISIHNEELRENQTLITKIIATVTVTSYSKSNTQPNASFVRDMIGNALNVTKENVGVAGYSTTTPAPHTNDYDYIGFINEVDIPFNASDADNSSSTYYIKVETGVEALLTTAVYDWDHNPTVNITSIESSADNLLMESHAFVNFSMVLHAASSPDVEVLVESIARTFALSVDNVNLTDVTPTTTTVTTTKATTKTTTSTSSTTSSSAATAAGSTSRKATATTVTQTVATTSKVAASTSTSKVVTVATTTGKSATTATSKKASTSGTATGA